MKFQKVRGGGGANPDVDVMNWGVNFGGGPDLRGLPCSRKEGKPVRGGKGKGISAGGKETIQRNAIGLQKGCTPVGTVNKKTWFSKWKVFYGGDVIGRGGWETERRGGAKGQNCSSFFAYAAKAATSKGDF